MHTCTYKELINNSDKVSVLSRMRLWVVDWNKRYRSSLNENTIKSLTEDRLVGINPHSTSLRLHRQLRAFEMHVIDGGEMQHFATVRHPSSEDPTKRATEFPSCRTFCLASIATGGRRSRRLSNDPRTKDSERQSSINHRPIHYIDCFRDRRVRKRIL